MVEDTLPHIPTKWSSAPSVSELPIKNAPTLSATATDVSSLKAIISEPVELPTTNCLPNKTPVGIVPLLFMVTFPEEFISPVTSNVPATEIFVSSFALVTASSAIFAVVTASSAISPTSIEVSVFKSSAIFFELLAIRFDTSPLFLKR